jgi:hypothetical protein
VPVTFGSSSTAQLGILRPERLVDQESPATGGGWGRKPPGTRTGSGHESVSRPPMCRPVFKSGSTNGNERTRYKTYWAMVIAERPSKKKEPKVAAERKTAERQESAGSSENPISTIKNFVCSLC